MGKSIWNWLKRLEFLLSNCKGLAYIFALVGRSVMVTVVSAFLILTFQLGHYEESKSFGRPGADSFFCAWML